MAQALEQNFGYALSNGDNRVAILEFGIATFIFL
jgi:hypothetical protein